ncbi:MAG: NfeD family protein [Alkalilacustris sp.]
MRLPPIHRPMAFLRRTLFGAAIAVGALGLASGQDSAPGQAPAVVLTVEGAVAPAMADFIIRNLDRAAEDGAPLVVLRMDTPGGLDSSMRQIIRAILASPVPVATWVAPSGARAASAGTYILYASHVAAMAPATNLGAATPVAIGGGGGGGGGEENRSPFPFGGGAAEEVAEESPDGNAPSDTEDATDAGAGTAEPGTPAEATGEDGAEPAARDPPRRPASASEAKVINDAVAYIRGLAEMRDRNADWAERAVREAVSLTATEAAAQNVIDFTAENLQQLFERADGMTVKMADGEITLETAGLTYEEVEPDWRTQILSAITNPNVALILMLVGVYGIIFEFLNPGVLIPGTIGGISLILGLYSLALLPLNYAGAGLIILGLALIVAEAFAPSFGILGIGGTAALVLGAVILVDTDAPGIDISVPLIAGIAAAGVITTFIVATLARRSFRARIVTGKEDMLDAPGRVTDWSGTRGHVFVHGERWQATGPAGLAPEDDVRVTAMDGLTLTVERRG